MNGKKKLRTRVVAKEKAPVTAHGGKVQGARTHGSCDKPWGELLSSSERQEGPQASLLRCVTLRLAGCWGTTADAWMPRILLDERLPEESTRGAQALSRRTR